MKFENVYGVEMTPLQNMMFSKWISNQGIAMNTYTTDGRREIAREWLNQNHIEHNLDMVKQSIIQSK